MSKGGNKWWTKWSQTGTKLRLDPTQQRWPAYKPWNKKVLFWSRCLLFVAKIERDRIGSEMFRYKIRYKFAFWAVEHRQPVSFFLLLYLQKPSYLTILTKTSEVSRMTFSGEGKCFAQCCIQPRYDSVRDIDVVKNVRVLMRTMFDWIFGHSCMSNSFNLTCDSLCGDERNDWNWWTLS